MRSGAIIYLEQYHLINTLHYKCCLITEQSTNIQQDISGMDDFDLLLISCIFVGQIKHVGAFLETLV